MRITFTILAMWAMTAGGQIVVNAGRAYRPPVVAAANYDTARFLFSLTARTQSGWNNITGHPHTAVRSVTDATTGIVISTRATTYWTAVSSATAAQNGGEETANPYYLWPQNVVLDYMFSNQTSCISGNEHIEVSGLTPLAYYTVQMMPSRNNANVTDATRQVRYVIRHNGTRTTLAAVDAKQNTTNIAQMINVQADASGKFWVGTYGNNENANSGFGYFNGMQIVRQNGAQ